MRTDRARGTALAFAGALAVMGWLTVMPAGISNAADPLLQACKEKYGAGVKSAEAKGLAEGMCFFGDGQHEKEVFQPDGTRCEFSFNANRDSDSNGEEVMIVGKVKKGKCVVGEGS